MPQPIEVKWANHGEDSARTLVGLYERAQMEIRETILEYDEKEQGNLRATHYRDIDKQVTQTLNILRQQAGNALTNAITGIMGGASGDAANEANGLFGNVNLGLSRINPKLVNYHVFRGLSKLQNVNDVITSRIREQLAFGQLKGMHAIAVAKMIGGQPPQRDGALVRTAGTGLTLEGIAPVFPSVMHRAYTIARTENGDAANAAFEDTLISLDEEDGLPIGKEWNNEVDKRTSDICLALGHSYGNNAILLSEAFLCTYNGKSYMRPTSHPNCRCRVEAGKLKGAALERWRAARRKRENEDGTIPPPDPLNPPVAPPKPVEVPPVKPPVVEPPKKAYDIEGFKRQAQRVRDVLDRSSPAVHNVAETETLGRMIDNAVKERVGKLEEIYPQFAALDKERTSLQDTLIKLLEEKPIEVDIESTGDWLSDLLNSVDTVKQEKISKISYRINAIDTETRKMERMHRESIYNETWELLKEIRPFGGNITVNKSSREAYAHYERISESVPKVTNFMPSEWIKESEKTPLWFETEASWHEIRGTAHYNHQKNLIAIKREHINNDGDTLDVTIAHEFGHRFEALMPRIKKAEASLMKVRTLGEYANNTIPQLPGFKADVRGFRDKFPSTYMGRIYSGNSNPYDENQYYEILSVLQERVIDRGAFEDDLQLRGWHLGVLAAL